MLSSPTGSLLAYFEFKAGSMSSRVGHLAKLLSQAKKGFFT